MITLESCVQKLVENGTGTTNQSPFSFSHEEFLCLLENIPNSPLLKEQVFEAAKAVRLARYGRSVFLRGLIEFSNYCTASCKYCGLRADHDIERFRLTPDEIIAQTRLAYDFGYRTFVLQSGEDPWYTQTRVVEIVKGIKAYAQDAAVTLSIGERTEEEFQAFFDAGADRYLLRHEAYSKTLYDSLHPGMSYENRIQCLKSLKKIGYQTGAGFMVGVKGQTLSHLAEDLCFLQELQPDMVGIGPFMPSNGTPFEKEPAGSADLTILLLAIVRLLLPHALLPLTTALVSLDPNIRELGFNVGANVLMPNLTPNGGGQKYKLYEQKSYVEGLSPEGMRLLSEKIAATNFVMDMQRGDVRK